MNFSNPWKKAVAYFQPLEKKRRAGSALIVALWVMIILAMLIGAFAFDMQIESGITSYYRKRMKAQALAQGGVEYAMFLLKQSFDAQNTESEDPEREELRERALSLSRGNPLSGVTHPLGDGQFTLDIIPEKGRRNVNFLQDEDWEEILDQGEVPEDLWPELIDCFNDWVDPGDEHRLNGAEKDDAYYRERGYEVKNAPLDTVDELRLIKGFTPRIVFGGPAETPGEKAMPGIAHLLTVWGGDGKVNINTADRDVLLTIPGITEEWMADDIITLRMGQDGKPGTKDDGFDSVDDVVARTGINDPGFRDRITTSERKFVRVVSIGQVEEVRAGVWCILDADAGGTKAVFWREEMMP